MHIARESRAFVVAPAHFQRAGSLPGRLPARESSPDWTCSAAAARRFSPRTARTSPARSTDEEGVLYADLEPQRLDEERQRFDPAGHYHRPDVFRLDLTREG